MNLARRLWHAFEFAAARVALGGLAAVPPRATLWVGRLGADIVFFCARGRRRVTIDNIRRSGIARDDRDATRIAREAFRSVAATVVETLVLRNRITPENVDRHVRFVVPDEVRALLEDPTRGMLVATAHVGNWDVMARAAALRKRVCAVYKPFKNPLLDRWLRTGRSAAGLRLVTKYDHDPLRLVRALRAGEMLAIMMDQHASRGVVVDYFGRKARTTPSVAMLHLVTRTPLVLAWAVRTGPLRYEVHAKPPIRAERTGDRDRDVLALTQRLTREIEDIARRWPEQYMWGHRRWKVSDTEAATETGAALPAGAEVAP